MNIKDIIFDTLEDKFGSQNIDKVLIKKDLLNSKTSLNVSFTNGHPTTEIETNFVERKQLDLMLINKVVRSIKIETGKKDVTILYIHINIPHKEITLCYETSENSKIHVFNN